MTFDAVFVHGGKQGSWVWDETITALHRQAGGSLGRVLALDVPGCGQKSNRPEPEFHLPDIIKELSSEIERADIRNGIIVSHSQGGTLVPGLVKAQHPRFKEALFVTTSVPLDGQTIAQMLGSSVRGTNSAEVGWPLPPDVTPPLELFRAMFNEPGMSEDIIEKILTRSTVDDWPSAASREDSDWGWEYLAKVKSTYLLAVKDNILPLAWQEIFASRLGAGTRRYYADGGHQIMQTQPDKVASIIIQVMQSVSSG